MITGATSLAYASDKLDGQPHALICRAEADLARGDLDAATSAAEAGLLLAHQLGDRRPVSSGNLVMTVSATRRLDTATSIRYANDLRNNALMGHSKLMPGQCVWAVTQALEARDGPASVASLISDLTMDEAMTRELLVSQPAAAAWLVRTSQQLDDEGIALRIVSLVDRLSAHNRTFRMIQASSAHAKGLHEKNADALERASALHLDGWASASALEDASAVRITRRPEQDRAADLLKRAAHGYNAVGARRDALRVASKLRELEGNGGRVPLGAGRVRSTVNQLTDTEYTVAELVSQGLTNGRVARQLFISPHTVAFHLKKIFRKLDVSSRVELATTWNRRPEEPAAAVTPEDCRPLRAAAAGRTRVPV
jgi:DNA-binding CsgD family transcriptional regulator